jgi:hypothetical protein
MLVSTRDSFNMRNGPRTFALILFTLFYFVFVVLFGMRLRDWDAYSPGQCYESGIMTVDYLPHSVPDLIYLGITAPVLIIAIFGSTCAFAASTDWWHNGIFAIALLEVSLPLFSIIVLRATQQNFLVSDESDNDFGFGQIIVMVFLLSVAFEYYRSFRGKLLLPPSQA